MKNKYSFIAFSLLILSVSFYSCKKEVPNIFNQFDVTVTLHNKLPLSVVDYKLVNDGDSVYFDYTITSPDKDMYMINLYKMGTNSPILKIPIDDPQQRRSYSGIIRLKMDVGVGLHTYRIYATDKDVVYLGDGYKTFSVEVANNYVHLPNRQIFFPDSAQGKLNSFLSLETGELFDYATTGAANSAKIDLGIYGKVIGGAWKGFIYSISASPNPFTPYDFSNWTKRETLFSKHVTGSAGRFLTTLNSGLNIRQNAQAETINLKSVSSELVAGSMVYFLTPEGKYGALIVNAISQTIDGKPFMNVSIKYEL